MKLFHKKPKRPPVQLAGGGNARLRKAQMTLWSVVAGVLGAGFIAGLYFGILQADWHVFWLKPWWDGLFKAPWWPVYRHSAFRDIPEPAFATMGVLTLLAKEKFWDKRVSNLRLATAPFILIAMTFALGTGGTWLLHYGLPPHARSVLAWNAAGDLILGFLIGRVLHAFWAPVGATLNGRILETQADKAAARRKVPLWVRYPLVPPVVRERFSLLYARSREVTGDLFQGDRRQRWIIAVIVVVAVLITGLGLAGHYWAGTGHVIPWLMSKR